MRQKYITVFYFFSSPLINCVRLGFYTVVESLGPCGSLFRGEQVRSTIMMLEAAQAGGMFLCNPLVLNPNAILREPSTRLVRQHANTLQLTLFAVEKRPTWTI